ncbi:hypothetical protein EDB81DRAFT_809638 [Dactylonectria macrodidyma]|uniref:Protein kinase domain-containing protein n=1 Tax=Dactylonectria macrodidyma TaxID=307937 RepID=A0A9P9IPB2_9HYPO|nr:hypothetical protein EDB81DRAFT_809638 [Dactylonectria macrodidyma]
MTPHDTKSRKAKTRAEQRPQSLVKSIRQTLVKSDFDPGTRKFSPEGSLKDLITRDSIVWAFCNKGQTPAEVMPKSMKKTVDFILARGRKLFAISILTGFKDERLRQVMDLFESNNISDSRLPLEESDLESLSLASSDPREDNKPASENISCSGDCYNNCPDHGNNERDDVDDDDNDSDSEDDEDEGEPLWDEPSIDHFCATHQWELCAPIFSANKINHDLHRQAILPFVKKHKDSADAGAFGQVIKYNIHKCHLDAHDLEIPNTQYVAVKHIELEKGQDRTSKIRGWEKEVGALWKMKALDQKHIVKFITAFRRGEEDHCLMLEWANGGNLRNLWKKFPRPTLTGSLVKATFEQLHGLAQALDKAHNPGTSEVDGFYRHGDLKPENILWFKDESGDEGKIGTLKIGDWGLAKNHPIITELRTKQTTTGYGTRRYESPEESTADNRSLMVSDPSGKLAKKRSRLYDVWAMGCIALEFLIWLMYGPVGLNKFNRNVRERLVENVPFYEIDRDGVAKVHRVVVKWMEHMARDPVCKVGQTALGNLLELIKDQLLVVKLPTGLGSSVDMLAMPNNIIPSVPSHSSTAAIDSPSSLPSIPNVPEITVTEAGPADASLRRGPQLDPAPKLPRSTRGARARSKDFLDRMEVISGDEEDESYWLTGVPLPPPEGDTDDLPPRAQESIWNQTEDSKREASQTRLEQLPDGQSLGVHNAHGAPTERLDDSWKYIIDNDFANRVLLSLKDRLLSLPAVSPSSKLCLTCKALREDLWAPDFSIAYDTSLFNTNTCDLCRLLSRVCQQPDITRSTQIRLERDGSTLIMNGYGPPVASIYRSPDLRTGIDQQIQVGLPSLPTAGSEPYLDIIRNWLETCDRGHLKCIRNSSGSSLGSLGPTKKLPTRVIAVGRKDDDKVRLLDTGPNDKGEWIALSHQWGTGPKFCTTKANLNAHLNGIDMDHLPDTFRDAVIVTRALGRSYLWIDSLCIIQGADGDFGEEAKRMEQVYSQAYCVLAASRSPGHQAGFLKGRKHRDSVGLQRDGDSPPFYICESIDDFDAHVLKGALNQRGWVLQEHALARRTVYFTHHQTYFECGDGVSCETMIKMKNQVAAFLGDPSFPQMMMKADKGEKILGYQDLYKRFCRLGLSHDTDRPWAINGLQERILTILEIKGGFGVFFEDQENGRRRGLLRRSLLWRRAEDNETLSQIDFSSSRVATKIPSWSWMAYTGGIDYIPVEFGGMDWSPIQTQWDSGPHRSDDGVLIAEARDYKLDDEHAKIVLDCGPVSEQLASKCVVLGKERKTMLDGDKMHYVLLVHTNAASDHNESRVYKRLGVGTLPGKCIESNGVEISIH